MIMVCKNPKRENCTNRPSHSIQQGKTTTGEAIRELLLLGEAKLAAACSRHPSLLASSGCDYYNSNCSALSKKLESTIVAS